MNEELYTKYLNTLTLWMKHYSFSEITVHKEAGADKVFVRSRFEASKFGKVDTYCCVKSFDSPTPADLTTFSSKMYDLANKHRKGAPLGFGAMMVAYPLIITENIPAEFAAAIKEYCPKHFASAEFPSILDLITNYLYYYENTPVWGYAYYANYRRESYNFFCPNAWKK